MRYSLITYLIIVLLGMAGCKRAFEPPAIQTDYHFLVVEGIIQTGNNAQTAIMLTRTKKLDDTTTSFLPETGAFLQIESEAGAMYNLTEKDDGQYFSDSANLPIANRYRLRITTSDGSQYQSDYTTPKTAPPIDSLTWRQDKDVTVFVNTHDPSGETHYYQWESIETWEYDSELHTDWGVNNNEAYPLDPDEQMFTCWIDAHSTNIVTTSSLKLSEDIISHQPVMMVLNGSEKISKRYSILVKQYGLTQQAFEYWQLIQKNTQQLGTLFDAQPTQLTGNIRNITNPSETVIGYISAGSTSEKRLFIDKNDVTNWIPTAQPTECYIKSIPQDPNNTLAYNYPDETYSVYYFVTGGIFIAKKTCLDCRLHGGANHKPSFW